MSFLLTSEVITRRGELPLEEIAKGDRILTHRGRWRRVEEVITQFYDGTAVLFEWAGGTRKLLVTKDQVIATPRGWLFADSISEDYMLFGVDGLRPDSNNPALWQLVQQKVHPTISITEIKQEVVTLVVEEDESFICDRVLVRSGGGLRLDD